MSEHTETPDFSFLPSGQQSQADFDVEFYRRLLARNDCNVDVLRRQAELLSRKGDHQGAAVLDRKLVQLLPTYCVAHYNLACSLAMTGNLAEAVMSLEQALRLGYNDWAHLESDSDLESLQCDPGFQKLLQRWGLGEC